MLRSRGCFTNRRLRTMDDATRQAPRHPFRSELEALRHARVRATDRLRHEPRPRQHRPRQRVDPAGSRLLLRGDGDHHPERAAAPRRLPREGDPGRLHHHRLRQRGRPAPGLGALAAQDPGRATDGGDRAGRDRRPDRGRRRGAGHRQEAGERVPRHLPRGVPAGRAGGHGAPHRGHDVGLRAQHRGGCDRRRLPAHRGARGGGRPHRGGRRVEPLRHRRQVRGRGAPRRRARLSRAAARPRTSAPAQGNRAVG